MIVIKLRFAITEKNKMWINVLTVHALDFLTSFFAYGNNDHVIRDTA